MELNFAKKKRVSLGRNKGFVPLKESDQKKEVILFRLSGEEKSYLDNICSVSNTKRSDKIRKYIEEGLTKDLQLYPTLF